jgi:hypothetical protein
MVRTLIPCVLLLAAARVAAADEAATNVSMAATNMPVAATNMPAAATGARATPTSVDTTRHGAKKHTTTTKADADKAEPQAAASEAAQPGGDVKMSGMSILGNEDAPKSLVLVPWKSSQLADMPSVSRLLDASTQPVDKDVFMRELAYYEFKSGSK